MVNDDTVGISASGGVTIKKFSGEDEDYDYEEWKETMKDLITLKKLKHVLEPTFALPTRTDPTTAWSDEQKKIFEDNDTASTWIRLATTGAPKELIKEGATLAREMLDRLNDEYDVGTESCDLEVVQRRFDKLQLVDGEKPSLFFVKLESINAKFK